MADKTMSTDQAIKKIERSAPKSSVPKNQTPNTSAETMLNQGAPEPPQHTPGS